MDSLQSSKDSVINLLTVNRSNMKDADIQLVYAYMNKQDYTTARTKSNALATARADWKALLLKLCDIYQEPDKIFSINRVNSYKTFLQGYANTNGKDGQTVAQSLLTFVCGINYTQPRPLPYGETMGDRKRTSESQKDPSPGLNSERNEDFSLYPNPARNNVILYDNRKNNDEVLIELKDLLGKAIFSTFSIGKELQIPLTGISNGTYLLVVSKDAEVLLRKKLIKQD